MKRSYWCIILVAALGIGVLAGAVDALFGRVLLWITAFRREHVWVLLPFLALAGLAIVFLYGKISPATQKGMGLVFDAARSPEARIPVALIPLVMCATWLTHLFGGSAGREGVAVQMGAAIGHNIGRRLGEPECARILLVTGMAAGFAGLFRTPIAAVFFAMEVLTAGVLQLDTLLPALIGSYTACNVSAWLGLGKFSVAVDAVGLTPETAGKCAVLAVLFGVTGGAFAWLLKWAKGKCADLLANPYWRIGIGGAVISVLSLLCFAGRYSGLGTNLIDLAFHGGTVYSWDFIAKLLFTVLTLAVGFQGGEVTPLFSIGAALGVAVAPLLGFPVPLAAALGYAAVFGGATNTLLAPIFIGCEVFGYENLPFFFLACGIAYVCSGDLCIYGGQQVSRSYRYPRGLRRENGE